MSNEAKGCARISISDLTDEEKENLANGNDILSCKVIPYSELDDDTLKCIYDYSGYEWVMEKRPDWIKKYHPEHLN